MESLAQGFLLLVIQTLQIRFISMDMAPKTPPPQVLHAAESIMLHPTPDVTPARGMRFKKPAFLPHPS
jgi:hypothetical protein